MSENAQDHSTDISEKVGDIIQTFSSILGNIGSSLKQGSNVEGFSPEECEIIEAVSVAMKSASFDDLRENFMERFNFNPEVLTSYRCKYKSDTEQGVMQKRELAVVLCFKENSYIHVATGTHDKSVKCVNFPLSKNKAQLSPEVAAQMTDAVAESCTVQ